MTLKITPLPADTWQSYRDIRLEALQADPLAFGGTYAEEIASSEDQWRNRINNMWFALLDNQVIGMIGLLRDTGSADKHRAHVISLWVRPAFRGQGIGGRLISYLKEWASGQGIRKLYLHVTSTQEAAIKLYENLGFKKVGLLKENTFIKGAYFDQYLMEWLCS